jgi:hypothetical protein
MRPSSAMPVLALSALLASCDGSGVTGARSGLTVAIAPLNLPGVGVVCYDLRVSEGEQVLWDRGDPSTTLLGDDQDPNDLYLSGEVDDDPICSDQFGGPLGLDLVYIGTCQVDTSKPAPTLNAVTLWIDGLYDDARSVDVGEWVDPCPDGCTVLAPCYENDDTRVEFNITVMREANQGFFDFAINFDKIFCSGKLDCTNDDAGLDPIRLLFNPHTRQYGQTIVVGRTCTGGIGHETRLLMSETEITCGYRPFSYGPIVPMLRFRIDPSTGDGNQWLSNVSVEGPPGEAEWPMTESELGRILFQNANYLGAQTLAEDGDSYGLIYANQAIGFDFEALQNWAGPSAWLVETCAIAHRWTADDGALPDFSDVLGAHTSYPVIEVGGELFDGGLSCRRNAINDPSGLVQTRYESLGAAYELEHCVKKDIVEGGLTSCVPEPL